MFLPETRGLLRVSACFYLLHILFQGKIALLELTSFWAIFFLGWAMVKGQIRPVWHILYYPLFVYGVISTISALAAPRRIHQGAEVMLWFKMLIFPTALTLLTRVPRLRDWAMRAHVVFGVGMATWGLIEYFVFHQQTLEQRINGPATHVMTYSGLILPMGLLFFVMWMHERTWLYGFSTLITTFALLLTFTRSVWLGWLVAVAVILLLTRWKWLFFATPALLLFITFMPQALFARFISTFDPTQSSNLDRIRMLEAGGEMIRDYPLLGVGPANVKEIYPLYKKHDAPRFRPPHLHNNVVQIWAERGIVALCAYLLFLGLFLRECARAWRTPARKWAEAGLAITIGLTYAGLFEFNWGDTEVFYALLDKYALVLASIVLVIGELKQPAAEPALPNEPQPVLVAGGA